MVDQRARLQALSEYLWVARVARADFHQYWNQNRGVDHGNGLDAEPEFFARMCIWYSMLWVVAEGWLCLNIQDANLERLLAPERQDLLKRFRNKTFHVQSTFPHPQMKAYLEQPDSVAYAYALSQELQRAVRQHLLEAGGEWWTDRA